MYTALHCTGIGLIFLHTEFLVSAPGAANDIAPEVHQSSREAAGAQIEAVSGVGMMVWTHDNFTHFLYLAWIT